MDNKNVLCLPRATNAPELYMQVRLQTHSCGRKDLVILRRTKEVEGLMMGRAATMIGLPWSHTEELKGKLSTCRRP